MAHKFFLRSSIWLLLSSFLQAKYIHKEMRLAMTIPNKELPENGSRTTNLMVLSPPSSSAKNKRYHGEQNPHTVSLRYFQELCNGHCPRHQGYLVQVIRKTLQPFTLQRRQLRINFRFSTIHLSSLTYWLLIPLWSVYPMVPTVFWYAHTPNP